MNELHRFSSTFTELARRLDGHVRTFTRQLELDMKGREIALTDLWVNIMPESVAHSGHIHPLSFISGTYYVVTPRGCPGLKFEDPRIEDPPPAGAPPPRRLPLGACVSSRLLAVGRG